MVFIDLLTPSVELLIINEIKFPQMLCTLHYRMLYVESSNSRELVCYSKHFFLNGTEQFMKSVSWSTQERLREMIEDTCHSLQATIPKMELFASV
jgi:hypothetical protein